MVRDLPPIQTGAWAWRGEALARQPDQWRWTLSVEELAELEDAAAGYRATGADIAALTTDAFPLPTLGHRIEQLSEILLRGRGFQVIGGLPVDRLSREEAATIFYGLGAHLGYVGYHEPGQRRSESDGGRPAERSPPHAQGHTAGRQYRSTSRILLARRIGLGGVGDSGLSAVRG